MIFRHLRLKCLLCAGLVCSAPAFAQFSVTLFASGLSAAAAPELIARGPDGAMWFTEVEANQIGRITTAGTVTEISAGLANSQPVGIASGPDGNMWVALSFSNQIARSSGLVAVPALSPAGLLMAAMLLAAVGWFALRGRRERTQ